MKNLTIIILMLILTISVQAQNWEWIETGFDFILMDIQFPEGQNQIGYCIGQNTTYNGDGIVIKTTDSGNTWTQITSDVIPGLTGMSFVDLNTGYAIGWNDYVIKTTDGGLTWNTLNVATGMWSFYYDIEFFDANNGVVLAGQDVYVTDDGGNTWSSANAIGASCNMITYINEDNLITVGYENHIYKSTDGGYTWTIKNQGTTNQVLLGVNFLNENYGMAAGDYGYIFTTTDGGETWTEDTQVGDWLLHTPFIWDENIAWVCGTPEQLFYTSDGGATWNNAYNGNYNIAFYRILFTDNYTGFISGSQGVVLRKEGLLENPVISVNTEIIQFDSTAVGNSIDMELIVYNTGNANLEVSEITVPADIFSVDISSFTVAPADSQIVLVTFAPIEPITYSDSLIILSNDPEMEALTVQMSGSGFDPVGIEYGFIIPVKLELFNNYPNPFNPDTNIAYSIKDAAKVTLEIYNIKGQLVKTLVNDVKGPGKYQAIWSGADEQNKPVSSGIYFYKIKAGTQESIKRMLLLK